MRNPTPNFVIFMIVCLLAACLLLPALALGNESDRPPPPSSEVAQRCAAEGGCVYASRAVIQELLDKAERRGYDNGKRDANAVCRNIT